METFLRDTEESTDDIPGRKKSKLKSLKTRLFRKSKKAGERSSSKLSQSASDITSGEGLGSDEDLVCTQGIMGSRALSHDSIFLADLALTDAEPSRVLSQENVQSKIKALQQKLQQQKLHLGQPPIVLPIRRPENQTCRSEDHAHNPSEMSEGHITTQEALNKALSQLSSNPLLPTPKTAPTKSVPSIVSTHPKPTAPVDELPLDFSTPAQFTPSLDTSAARHRMSVKPRNQRASTKKRLSAVESTSLIADLNNTETVKEEDGQLEVQEEVTVKMGIVDIPLKLPETTPVLSEPTKPETTSKTSSLLSPQQDITILEKIPTVTSQILRPKPHRSADVMPTVRPHSSFISSEVKGKSERSAGNFLSDKQDKTWTSEIISKMVSSEQLSSGPGSVLQPTVVYGQTDGSSGIKRLVPGAGSFHLSVAAAKSRMEAEGRPRSGSFTGICEHAGAWLKTGESSPYFKEKGDIEPNESTVEMGRLRQETAQHKTWETTDSLGKVQSVRQSKSKATDIGESEGAVKEVEEEEGKTTFGIKLRATSQSIRMRAEVSSNEHLKSALTEEKQQKQEISINANQMSKKTSVNVPCTVAITGEAKPTDVSTAPSAVNVPAKQTPQSSSVNTLLVSTGGQSVSSNSTQVNNTPQTPQEPQPVPHASPTDVSWMSLAMEKTRSLQSLFTNKFPRDFTGVQTSARSPKIQVQTMNQAQAETQTQSVKNTNQPSMDAVKTETLQHKSQAQTVKQSLPATTAQQRTPKTATSQSKSDTSKEVQISKPTDESQPTLTEPVIQPVAQSNMWTSQSPLRSIRQVESTSQSTSVSLAQSGLPSPQHATAQKPPWSTRSLRSAGSACTSPSQATTVRVDDGAANVQEKEDKSVWAGSVSKKAVFLEKRAEWSTSPAEVKKTETLTPSESSAQSTPQNKDAKAGESAGVKHTESSPRKIPERPKDEKWLQKTTSSSSCPTSSPTLSSSLQSMSDTREPSWMELAKRKSMAWSDKTMD